jgi:isocitrate dehydrogenase
MQSDDASLAEKFTSIAAELEANEAKIVEELIVVQGSPVDTGGYYQPCDQKVGPAMRPSATFNAILEKI